MARRKRKRQNNLLRINLIILGIFALAGVFIARLFVIQVLRHEEFKAMAESQYRDYQELPSKRGEILSSDGYALATVRTAYLLYAEPKQISDPLQVANDLAAALSSSKEEEPDSENPYDGAVREFEPLKDRFYEALSTDLYWVALEHRLTEQEKESVEELGILGIGFEEEPVRYYPEKTLAAHVLGFVADNERGEEQGYYGIEGNLDGDLQGKPGRIIEERDATGAPILMGGYTKVDPTDGRDVVLSIDRSAQYIVEKKLEQAVKNYNAVSGSVIVMDPNTGDVLAMANYPTYNPLDFNEEVKESTDSPRQSIQRRNLSISETYEPGSVIKGLTISAGIDLGKITPQSTFVDSGPVMYSGHTIDNWDGKHHGLQNVIQLLQKSNNIGAAWVGHLIGAKNLSMYFENFGLGNITGVDLEGEDTGIIRDYKDWTDIDLAAAAFGQGISATPLQVLNAFNVIANGGTLMRPRIVTKVVEGKEIIEIPVKPIRKVITKETSDTMVDLLTKAVEGGESRYFNIKDYKVAGKTGTAQIPVNGEYDPNETNATFVGFLPTTRKFSMIVRFDRPESSIYAAETAVPLWMDIAGELVRYYGIPSDKTPE